jgi:head-tail adaptor
MTWPSINPGELRHLVTINQQQASSDASGNEVAMVELYLDVPAKCKIFKGTDVIKSGQQTTNTYLTVTIWFQPGILPNMQLQRKGDTVTYLIQSIDNLELMDIVLVLNCLAIGNA